MQVPDLKAALLRYVTEQYQQKGIVPSIDQLVKSFRAQGLTRSGFYELFGGLPQLCLQAGVPVPERRVNRTKKALKQRMGIQKLNKSKSEGTSSNRLVLSENQSMRIFALSHLNNGKSPTLIVDEILNRDAMIRKLLDQQKHLVPLIQFLEQAVDRKWSIDWLVDIITNLWNSGASTLSAADFQIFVGLLQELKKYNVDPVRFVRELTEAKNIVNTWRKYKAGEVSAEEVLRSIDAT